MVLTREENELLTRVGSGTPMGELLRRYWHPVAVAQELTDEQPTKFVRILGEDLVLFKDKSGNVGLIQDHCAHRGASLLYGRVEERGIACAYHGWLYDTSGSCLECPAEPAGSMFHLTVRMVAYPVQKFCGLYWAYLGPLPAPVIPRYDVWVREDGVQKIDVYPRLDCNWFQATENSVDPAHLQILHQDTNGRRAPNTTRGFTDDIASFDFYETPYGIIKKRTYTNGRVDEHPLIFPNILRVSNVTQIRVPIDDAHTSIFFIRFVPGDLTVGARDEEPEVTYVEPFKSVPEALHPFTRFRMDKVLAQDHMAWETQGPIADRTTERLATSDRGIVLLRTVMKREIERVQRGEDPKAVIRDPNHGTIDTNLSESLAQQRERGGGDLLPELTRQ
ncbi:MAG: 5,5-dehydrodivanillate O-demethylase oxygenase subunit [Chloroflexota bacterium]|jgi:5,5'-dehydrodivanillate O-demethylase|nr:5,5-dehydrodivanillate O-demethylase oxygenase subunit [Chloroflexota bacterium]